MTSTCEFCENALPRGEPENVALLHHIERNPDCEEQYGYMLENLRNSWTISMSGG